jgi:hypothetical protein
VADVLSLQDDEPETPAEEKGSMVSLWGCTTSNKSFYYCWGR